MSTNPSHSSKSDSKTCDKRKAIIVSVTSGIGTALAQRWLSAGWDVSGTFRNESSTLQDLKRQGLTATQCDLESPESISSAIEELKKTSPEWDALILCPATLEPIGRFVEVDFTDWSQSIKTNFTTQLEIVHGMLDNRRPEKGGTSPCVLFFAAGGTNSSVDRFSAYTVSKIALIKMVELLDTEISDTRFSIIGPGWVDTKIHQETLSAGDQAGPLYERTVKIVSERDFTPMEVVLDCCEWVVNSSREVVSGRNFSVVYDRWGDDELEDMLSLDGNMYKLRRDGNDKLVKLNP